jgi:hypothetical protein
MGRDTTAHGHEIEDQPPCTVLGQATLNLLLERRPDPRKPNSIINVAFAASHILGPSDVLGSDHVLRVAEQELDGTITVDVPPMRQHAAALKLDRTHSTLLPHYEG